MSELEMAERLKGALRPVRPSDAFRERLGAGLQLAAHHQTARLGLRVHTAEGFKYWWLGAAALGASVAAGSLIAWVVRSRLMAHAQPRLARGTQT